MIKYLKAPEIKSRINEIVNTIGWSHIRLDNIFCFRTERSKAKYTRARCWGLPRVWQQALNLEPYYIIELLGDFFDGLCDEHRDKLLIHELLHIPRTFSGALKPHVGSFHKAQVTQSVVDEFYDKLNGKDVFVDFSSSRSVNTSIDYFPAPRIKSRVEQIVNTLGWSHVVLDNVVCVKSRGTKSDRLHARCHGFPKIWQLALGIEPYYIIEVLSENFFELDSASRDRLLIQELLYLPKSFSGALRPHTGYVSMSIVNKHHKVLREQEGLSWI